jgi:hypothetical protein
LKLAENFIPSRGQRRHFGQDPPLRFQIFHVSVSDDWIDRLVGTSCRRVRDIRDSRRRRTRASIERLGMSAADAKINAGGGVSFEFSEPFGPLGGLVQEKECRPHKSNPGELQQTAELRPKGSAPPMPRRVKRRQQHVRRSVPARVEAGSSHMHRVGNIRFAWRESRPSQAEFCHCVSRGSKFLNRCFQLTHEKQRRRRLTLRKAKI